MRQSLLIVDQNSSLSFYFFTVFCHNGISRRRFAYFSGSVSAEKKKYTQYRSIASSCCTARDNIRRPRFITPRHRSCHISARSPSAARPATSSHQDVSINLTRLIGNRSNNLPTRLHFSLKSVSSVSATKCNTCVAARALHIRFISQQAKLLWLPRSRCSFCFARQNR